MCTNQAHVILFHVLPRLEREGGKRGIESFSKPAGQPL